MSGIAGIWNRDGRPASGDVLASMTSRLRARGVDGEAHRIDGAAGFACQHLWVCAEDHGVLQPLVGSSGAMIVIDGRIDNREELVSALTPHGDSDAALALAAYERWGDRAADYLAGDFALAVFDPRERRLILARDAIGIRPLYYFQNSRLMAFGSEIKALLAHPDIPAEPDEEGVADFMLIGSRPLDRQDLTCFRNISSVVPAHVVVVTPERVTRRRYWDFDTTRRLHLGSFGEYVDAFRERFVRSVKRRTRSRYPVAMSVSGGLDSSSVFCQAETLRRAGVMAAPAILPISYVSDRSDSDEQRFLRAIETRYGIMCDRFPIEPLTGLVRGVEDLVGAIEAPLLDYMWGITQELHTRAAASGARSMLSGHWGDQMLFSSAYLVDLFRRGAWRTILRHTREYERYFGTREARVRRRAFVHDVIRHHVPRAVAPALKWLSLRVLDRRHPKPWFTSAFLHRALRRRYRLATFDRPFHSAHARAVYVEARSKYHVQCMEWNAKVGAMHGLDVAFPFLDRDLIGFLMAIPGEVHARDGVPRVLLREAMRGVLPESIRSRTWKADFSPFVNLGLREDAAAILRTLTPDCLGVRFGYLDAERLMPSLTTLAAGLNADDCADSWDLGDTYGLEMWLQVFWRPRETRRSPGAFAFAGDIHDTQN
jgi:asparagine synthase (glutamine-hydrolysing)